MTATYSPIAAPVRSAIRSAFALEGGLKPAVDWNFAGGVMPSALTFARASTATYYDVSGALVTAASGSPRLTYDPVTHSALGLLVEGQRTNLLLNSRLDGTNLSTQSVTVAATQYTLSFYGTGQIVLSGSATATVVGTGAFPTQKTYTFTPSAGSLTLTVTGTVQFAQLEAGAFATSYIPTGAASATRAADVVTCTGSAFSQWFNAAEGTIVVETFPSNVVSLTARAVWLENSSTDIYTNFMMVSGFAATERFEVSSGGVAQFSQSLSTVTAGARTKAAFSYAAAAFSCVLNGGAAVTAASGSLPPGIDTARIGSHRDSTALNAPISRIRYWRKRLTNAQLQALTA